MRGKNSCNLIWINKVVDVYAKLDIKKMEEMIKHSQESKIKYEITYT